MPDAELLVGHVLDVLGEMPEASVNCVVTSPPYWSLRKYDAEDVIWGGDPECGHEWSEQAIEGEGYTGTARWQHTENGQGRIETERTLRDPVTRKARPEAWSTDLGAHGSCSRCGAWRGQYGLEPTPDLYVEHTVTVLRAIRRVLRDDGTVYWNIGDSYASGKGTCYNPGGGESSLGKTKKAAGAHPLDRGNKSTLSASGLKPKDLVLMPFRVALAAQADGWWVRSVVIWNKPNAMPESTQDRPTTAHEYVLMLTKKATYWYDQEAVRESVSEGTIERFSKDNRLSGSPKIEGDGQRHGFRAAMDTVSLSGRNLRSVWTFPTAQTPEAHFATFPEALPARCIAASCPREVCAKCGTARVRIVETRPNPAGITGGEHREVIRDGGLQPNRPRDYEAEASIGESHTLGWSSCACPEPDYQPGLVLDPFAGIGTTLIVARQLGRSAIGIELSEAYAEIARKKMALWFRKSRQVEAESPKEQGELL